MKASLREEFDDAVVAGENDRGVVRHSLGFERFHDFAHHPIEFVDEVKDFGRFRVI